MSTIPPLPMLSFVPEVPKVDTSMLSEQEARQLADDLTTLGATVSLSRGCYVLTIPAAQSFGKVETQIIGTYNEPLVSVVRRAIARGRAA